METVKTTLDAQAAKALLRKLNEHDGPVQLLFTDLDDAESRLNSRAMHALTVHLDGVSSAHRLVLNDDGTWAVTTEVLV
jgi:hypothetical protein